MVSSHVKSVKLNVFVFNITTYVRSGIKKKQTCVSTLKLQSCLLNLWCVEETADRGDSRPLLPLLLETPPPPRSPLFSLYISTLPG